MRVYDRVLPISIGRGLGGVDGDLADSGANHHPTGVGILRFLITPPTGEYKGIVQEVLMFGFGFGFGKKKRSKFDPARPQQADLSKIHKNAPRSSVIVTNYVAKRVYKPGEKPSGQWNLHQ